jgi:ribosome biogenesis SPOUT family RNA methylase Rps3
MIFIIEHLDKLGKWNFIEYKHISSIVGKKNLWFTNCKSGKLKKYGKVISRSVRELGLERVCVLDPEADGTLSPSDKKKFKFFVFGGILGDFPRRKRTRKEIARFFSKHRNLGKKQMTTDNAVYAVKKILSGKKFSELEFLDKLELKTGKYESIILPFRYNIVNGKPLISSELLKFIERKKGF